MFNYQVAWSKEDQEFVGLCDQFPSLSWLDLSAFAALEGIQALVDEVLNDMRSNNEPILTIQAK